MAEKHATYEVSESPEKAVAADGFDSTSDDRLHMQRMGKTQEMNRAFRQVSLVSFTAICK